MTKFQRGELMEGWNDCPVPMSAGSSNSSVGTPKPRKRVSRLPGFQPPDNDSGSAPAPPRDAPAASGAPPVGLRKQAEGVPQQAPAKSDIDVEATESTLRDMLEASQLAPRDKDFFTKRLVEPYAGLELQHKQFIAEVVGAIGKETPAQLKTRVLNYMVVTSGVSTWGVPLKKLVEAMGQ